MPLIQRLPSQVIDQIAAGEVIERPASVVKELLENAIDASADTIEVLLRGGGIQSIEVRDNGCGMSPTDAALSLQRHATSKLRRPEDLIDIATLGFRGEALSSIASISRVRLTTRTADQEVATRIEVEGGIIESTREVGAPIGTTFEVRDLFYNTPARHKFLRAPSTEQSHITRACQRVLLGAHGRGLVLRSEHRRLLHLPRLAPEKDRVSQALGREIEQLFAFTGERDGITVRGFIAPPDKARTDTRGIWIFVNGRFVRDGMLQRALLDGCAAIVPHGRYPVIVLHVEVSPQNDDTIGMVDVNVHPQKTEVRFTNTRSVFSAVATIVMTSVGEIGFESKKQKMDTALNPQLESTRAAVARFYGQAQQREHETRHKGTSGPSTHTSPEARGDTGSVSAAAQRNVRAIHIESEHMGPSAQNTPAALFYREGDFLWLTHNSRLWLVHLPRMSIALMTAVVEGKIPPNPHTLLLPVVMPTISDAEEWLAIHSDRLESIGFHMECVGPHRLGISEIPSALTRIELTVLLEHLTRFLNAKNTTPLSEFPWAERILAAPYTGTNSDALADFQQLTIGGADAPLPSTFARVINDKNTRTFWR